MTRPAGYTLLEMVVVMGVLALATALVAPTGFKMVRTWQDSSRVDEVFKQLRSLPMSVRKAGRPLLVSPEDSEQAQSLVDLPEGWQLRFTTALAVRANGACSEAEGALVTEHQTLPFRIEAPFCRVTRIDPPA